MKTLLRIDSSPRKNSKTRELTDRFEQKWLVANPDGLVIRRDLSREPLPFLTEEWILANYTKPESLSEEQKRVLAKSDELLEELFAADEIVIGSPMWNFGAPASMKAYIDLIARAGKTFRYSEKGPQGLLSGKRAVVITARGGFYSKESPVAHWDFQEPYLRRVLEFLGISDISFVHAEFQGKGGEQAAKSQAAAELALEAWIDTSVSAAAA